MAHRGGGGGGLAGLGLYDSLRQSGSTAALVESLQAQLKQREGTVLQLQMELGQLERARDNMASEVARLTQKLDGMGGLQEELARVTEKFHQMEQKYQTMLTVRDALLPMYTCTLLYWCWVFTHERFYCIFFFS